MIVIVDYQAGNIHNVARALRFLGASFCVSADPEDLEKAEAIILPGVGAADAAMESLHRKRLLQPLRHARCPVLGICLGLQLFYESSEEGVIGGLGILPGRVRRFDPDLGKVPHMGWNRLSVEEEKRPALLRGVADETYFYFVHSYYASLSQWTRARTQYTVDFSSVVTKENFSAVQFHPELSGKAGLRLLENFVVEAARFKRDCAPA